MKESEGAVSKRKKTVWQALKELVAGYDVLGNLKFLVIAFFGLFGFTKGYKN